MNRVISPAPIHYYARHNFEKIPQIQRLSAEDRLAIRVVSAVLPFKVNDYVVNELIDWEQIPHDPIYRLTFPHRDMLEPEDFRRIADLLSREAPTDQLQVAVHEVRGKLNPHPAGQMTLNVPTLDGEPIRGLQHKYRETVLFFPAQGQTCHAYCTFCFRWPQFVGVRDMKFQNREVQSLVRYLQAHPEVSDVLITGGDPMIMPVQTLRSYIEPLLELEQIQSIRIGSKSLSYWPHRYLTDPDSEEILQLFRQVRSAGKNLAYMAHFNHPRELSTTFAQQAIGRILDAGCSIRCQSPLVRHINDDPHVWADMWRTQVRLGCIPYYMFVERDTGARHYFEVPLVDAWKLFQEAYQQVSGLARTVRGPSMSAFPGKVAIDGVTEVAGEKVLALHFIQGRNPDWANRPFFARLDPKATWLDQLRPAFGESEFFYERELRSMLGESQTDCHNADRTP